MFCHHCDDSLAGHRYIFYPSLFSDPLLPRYVLRDDHPYCIKVRKSPMKVPPMYCNVSSNAGCTTDGQLLQCYENVFANNCDECGKIIGIDSKDLSYKEKHWHEACFLCNKVTSKTYNHGHGFNKNFTVSNQSCGQAVWFKGGQNLLRPLL